MTMEFRPNDPCSDCVDGSCSMNCSRPGKFVDWRGFQPAATAPKNGDPILVCRGKFDDNWTFKQSPPSVVHYWSNPGEEGFYMSSGGYDEPVVFDWWRPLLGTEPREY